MKPDDATATSLPSKPLQIHDKFMVQWRGANRSGSQTDFVYLPAVIIERRLARRRGETVTSSLASNKRKRKASSTNVEISGAATNELDCLPADALEYYIHYIDHDRYAMKLTRISWHFGCRHLPL